MMKREMIYLAQMRQMKKPNIEEVRCKKCGSSSVYKIGWPKKDEGKTFCKNCGLVW